jgi:hypothetical protein
VQSAQAAPAVPHAESWPPISQTPLLSQQPVHVEGQTCVLWLGGEQTLIGMLTGGGTHTSPGTKHSAVLAQSCAAPMGVFVGHGPGWHCVVSMLVPQQIWPGGQLLALMQAMVPPPLALDPPPTAKPELEPDMMPPPPFEGPPLPFPTNPLLLQAPPPPRLDPASSEGVPSPASPVVTMSTLPPHAPAATDSTAASPSDGPAIDMPSPSLAPGARLASPEVIHRMAPIPMQLPSLTCHWDR